MDLRVRDILDRCTRCAKCVEVCPTAAPAGIDTSEPAAIVGDVLDILRDGGDPSSRGARWANACTGSGRCISACDDGINPRFMLAATRLRLNERRQASERRATGRAGFKKMSTAVKVLSRLQLPADLLAGFTRAAAADSEPAPDIVMYLGCNVLKTPHIALLCLEVLARLGTRYKVFAGPAYCCGVIQYRAGDTRTSGQIGGNTVAGFAGTGAPRVLTWCPTCNIQLSEIVMPSTDASFNLEHVVPYIAARIERLRPHFVHSIHKRVALHEHPGVAGVTEGAIKILTAIPGLELVDLEQPRVDYMCNSLARAGVQTRAARPRARRGGSRGRRLSRRHLPCLPSRAMRPRNHFAVQDRQFSGAGRRGHGRRENGSLQAVENDARRRPRFSGSRSTSDCDGAGLRKRARSIDRPYAGRTAPAGGFSRHPSD